ncbi:hypothetical protein Rhe02_73110 [Rhizocola hellebori]|uniref:Uncharacterized protein n=1 Tax=Rhizocola hellebori TaxID=1392758 RepID=A0A8J3QGJ4_9ACTN|nr:hypothetical protein [Rhizocola hellebori]GIH09244.1 hypothetical protein Rhe02_73110 [Rhizocola hellebori]
MAAVVLDQFLGEYEPNFIGTGEDLRQGDILQMIPKNLVGEVGLLDRHFAVVVTANCDLTWSKHDGVLTCVPLIPALIYTHHIQVPRLLDRRRAACLVKIAKALVDADQADLVERVHEMLELGQTASVIRLFEEKSTLLRQKTSEVQQFSIYRSALDRLQHCDELRQSLVILRDAASQLDQLHGRKPNNALTNFVEALKETMGDKMPGDFLFINSLAENLTDGYVAILRMLRDIRQSEISLTATEERRRPGLYRARRISRLNVLYVHKLVQHMARVFTDIGLPEDYSKSRDARIKVYGDLWATCEPNSDEGRQG